MHSLRTKKIHEKYKRVLTKRSPLDACVLCKKIALKEFKYWKIVHNRFSWDRIAKIHHMIIPKRHIVYEQLNTKEKKEFESIKSKYIDKKYELIAEMTAKEKSIPEHFHVHLIIMKKLGKK